MEILNRRLAIILTRYRFPILPGIKEKSKAEHSLLPMRIKDNPIIYIICSSKNHKDL
jgi:hypothetical protein